MLKSNSKSLGNDVVSPEEDEERLQWEGFAEKEVLSLGDGKLIIKTNKYDYYRIECPYKILDDSPYIPNLYRHFSRHLKTHYACLYTTLSQSHYLAT